jgi:hypothetical protein
MFDCLVRWCNVNEREYAKCIAWASALSASNITSSSLACIAGLDKFDCYRKIFNDEADLMTADSGEIYTAGRYYNLVPIANELYSPVFNGQSFSLFCLNKNEMFLFKVHQQIHIIPLLLFVQVHQ